MVPLNVRQVIPFFAYPIEVRPIVYIANATESLHMQVRQMIKNRGHFPNDEAASKLISLALRNTTKEWEMPPQEWKMAMTQFAILFGHGGRVHRPGASRADRRRSRAGLPPGHGH